MILIRSISIYLNLNNLFLKYSSNALAFINLIYENISCEHLVLASLAFITYFYFFIDNLPNIKFTPIPINITPSPAKNDIPI